MPQLLAGIQVRALLLTPTIEVGLCLLLSCRDLSAFPHRPSEPHQRSPSSHNRPRSRQMTTDGSNRRNISGSSRQHIRRTACRHQRRTAALHRCGTACLLLHPLGRLSVYRQNIIWFCLSPEIARLQTFGDMAHSKLDPFSLVAKELESVSERLRRTILTEIPVLSTAAEYFFKVHLCLQRLEFLYVRKPSLFLHTSASGLSARHQGSSSTVHAQLGSEGKRLRPTILLLMASSLSAVVPPAAAMHSVDMRPPATHVTEHRRRQQRIAEVPSCGVFASLWSCCLPPSTACKVSAACIASPMQTTYKMEGNVQNK